MFCENCGAQLNDDDRFCMQCGWSVRTEENAAQSMQGVQPEIEAAKVLKQSSNDNILHKVFNVFQKFGMQGGKKFPFVIILASVAVLIAIIGFHFSSIAGLLRSTFSSPEEYYRYVEEKAASEIIDTMLTYYELYVENMDISDKSTSTNVTVELSEDLRDLIGMTGIDVDWLEKGKATLKTNVKDKQMSIDAVAAANQTTLLTGHTVVDLDEEMLYLQLPELNQDYIGMEFYGDDIEDAVEVLTDVLDQIKIMRDTMPDKNRLDKLMTKYVKMALECVEDVDKDKKELKAEGISKKYVRLKTSFDPDLLLDMAEVVIEEMQNDSELEQLILECAGCVEDYSREDADDVYDELMRELDYLLEDMEYMAQYYDDEMEMTVWVDAWGNVVGREILVDNIVLKYKMPMKGSKFGLELSLKDYSNSISLTGTGKKSGNKYSGEFEISYGSAGLVELSVKDCDAEKFKDGYLCGNVTVGLSKGVIKLLENEYAVASNYSAYYSSLLSTLMDYSISLETDSSKGSYAISMAAYDDVEELAVIDVDGKYGKGSEISTPKNVTMIDDEDELMDWIENMAFDTLLDKLEDEVEVPSDWIDMIEDILEWYDLY